jgi:hypothetical protein
MKTKNRLGKPVYKKLRSSIDKSIMIPIVKKTWNSMNFSLWDSVSESIRDSINNSTKWDVEL